LIDAKEGDMGTLVGFVAGYILGARQGPEGHAKLRQAIETLLGTPEFKALVERGLVLSELMTGGGRAAREGSNGANGQSRGLLEPGQLQATWRTIADSETFQSVVATGLSMPGDLFERGKTLLDERRGRSNGSRDTSYRRPRGRGPGAAVRDT
jgi:hypothetical protein